MCMTAVQAMESATYGSLGRKFMKHLQLRHDFPLRWIPNSLPVTPRLNYVHGETVNFSPTILANIFHMTPSMFFIVYEVRHSIFFTSVRRVCRESNLTFIQNIQCKDEGIMPDYFRDFSLAFFR